ncbi:Pheromone receptor STE3p, putative [Cryptococcus gattii WM276]|uniref:Pheromone receptor STE3p, putative n=3 Tax=Cryptococcus gattii species complex TaxID=1884637 RepID=E6RBT7_CRYGW|nr:Pheromone receptor STE3p, putative [Cryptococcus gattii WM276]AAV28793.1 STE3p [Cryptococcus gattii]ADV24257.1 Pheromone receptor STE3p, putative [Cryptococcus gattii WM276]KIR76410.1 pheromone a factor receptor [Cryptococcus gattii EJB2]
MHDLSLVIFSGIGILLVLLPLPLHWRARNAGTLLLITWLFIANVIFFVNGIVWWNSYDLPSSPIWCDIASKLFIGVPVGISATSLCITRRLVMIASSTAVTINQRQKHIALAIDLFLGIGMPMLVMALHYIVQPHRVDIIEGYGCQPVTWPGIPALFAVTWWSPLLTIIAAGYGVVALRFFLYRRLQFHTVLRSSRGGLDSRHYLRLMALASVDIILGLPATLFTLIVNIRQRQSYPSWDWVHLDWSRIELYPASSVLPDAQKTIAIVLPRWLAPLLSIIFFLFFGVSIDAMGEYARWFRAIQAKTPFLPFHQKEILPIAAPKLGSTIVKPSGADWKDSTNPNDDPLEGSYFDDLDRFDSTPGVVRGGVMVAVSVERAVV